MLKSEVVSTQDDITIIVLGPTGAGKSTFIQYAVEEEQGSAIGHNLRSCTQEIRFVRSKRSFNGHPIVFIDTPGFDDKSDVEVLSLISKRLIKVYGTNLKLAGIIYLHKISDNRMAGPPLTNFNLLANACGKTAIPNLTLITTMWGDVPIETGERREEELKSSFWKEMIERDCPVERFGDTNNSALDIVALSLKTNRDQLYETVTLNKQLEKLLDDRKDVERRLQEIANNSRENRREIEALEEKKAELRTKIVQTEEKMRSLKIKISLPRRLWRYFQRMFPRYQKPESFPALTL